MMDTQKRQRKPSETQLDVLRFLSEADYHCIKLWRLSGRDHGAIGYIVLVYRERGGDMEHISVNRTTFRALTDRGYVERRYPSVDGIEYWTITDAGRKAVKL